MMVKGTVEQLRAKILFHVLLTPSINANIMYARISIAKDEKTGLAEKYQGERWYS